MDNNGPVPTGVGRREPSLDPVKAQGILRSVVKKEKESAKLWQQRWSFYTQNRQIQEEEALKIGMSLEEYREAVRALSNEPERKPYMDVMDPSPMPVPLTSSGMIGRRAKCPLERYGRLVKTGQDYPIHPPLPPGQVYDPYKQTMFFLGIDIGDPISHKLPPEGIELTDDMLVKSQQLSVSPLDLYFKKVANGH